MRLSVWKKKISTYFHFGIIKGLWTT